MGRCSGAAFDAREGLSGPRRGSNQWQQLLGVPASPHATAPPGRHLECGARWYRKYHPFDWMKGHVLKPETFAVVVGFFNVLMAVILFSYIVSLIAYFAWEAFEIIEMDFPEFFLKKVPPLDNMPQCGNLLS